MVRMAVLWPFLLSNTLKNGWIWLERTIKAVRRDIFVFWSPPFCLHLLFPLFLLFLLVCLLFLFLLLFHFLPACYLVMEFLRIFFKRLLVWRVCLFVFEWVVLKYVTFGYLSFMSIERNSTCRGLEYHTSSGRPKSSSDSTSTSASTSSSSRPASSRRPVCS